MRIEKIKQKKWYQKLVNWHVFFVALISEILEETMEEIFATTISWLFSKSISLIFAIGITQGTKLVFKKLVKCFTYKEGKDKMEKLKTLFKNLKEKLTNNIVWSNKITISGWLSVAVMTLEGADVVDIVSVLPELCVYGFNIMPYLFYVVLAFLSLLGVGKQGLESVKTYLARIEAKDKVKEEKNKELEKEKEIAKELKQLQEQQKATLEAQARAIVEAKANNQ